MENVKLNDNRLFSLVVLYDMHTGFYSKALDGISDEDANKRLDTKANHIAWIAGSLVSQRFELAKILGQTVHQNTGELFADNKGIIDNAKYPTLEDYKKDWELITPVLRKILEEVGTEKLDSKFEMMPGESFSHYELVSFMIYREANCIGQIALWRRLLGYPAMNYM